MSTKLFKDVLVYQLTQEVPAFLAVNRALLNEGLSGKPARMPGPTELGTFGFVSPCGEQGLFVEKVGNAMLIKAEIWKRDLPGSVVARELKIRIDKIEKDEDRKVLGKERRQLKDEVILSLLPRAFPKGKTVSAFIDRNFIYVDTASAKVAEQLLSVLREIIGSLPVRPLLTRIAPVATLTEILKTGDTQVENVILGDKFVLASVDESGTISGSQIEVDHDDIRELLHGGRQATRLGFIKLSEYGAASFILCDDMAIRGIAWPDLLYDQAEAEAGDQANAIIVASTTYLLIFNALAELVDDAIRVLGGLDDNGAALEASLRDFEQTVEKAFKNVSKITRDVKPAPAADPVDEDLI